MFDDFIGIEVGQLLKVSFERADRQIRFPHNGGAKREIVSDLQLRAGEQYNGEQVNTNSVKPVGAQTFYLANRARNAPPRFGGYWSLEAVCWPLILEPRRGQRALWRTSTDKVTSTSRIWSRSLRRRD